MYGPSFTSTPAITHSEALLFDKAGFITPLQASITRVPLLALLSFGGSQWSICFRKILRKLQFQIETLFDDSNAGTPRAIDH